MTSFDQDDIGISIAVEVGYAGVGRGFRNCLQRNNFESTETAGREFLSRMALGRESIRMKND